MKLLLNERNLIVAMGNSIEYGVWGNMKDISSWKITDSQYMMDSGFHLVDIGEQEIPNYVHENEYYYIDGEFKLADECPNEYKDRIVVLEDAAEITSDELMNTQLALADQYETNLVIEEELLNTQLALTDQYEQNDIINTDLLNVQLALAEQYETNMALEETIITLQEEIIELKSIIEGLKITE